MVDTIVLRIHDLRKHKELLRLVEINFNGTVKHTAYLSKEEKADIINSPNLDAKDYIDYYTNPRAGTHLVRFKSQDKLNNSGHYYFHVYENLDMDYLEFNFSIPKYKYGTNILMFCPHYWDKEFNFGRHCSLDYNLRISYDRLLKFIKDFFIREFLYEDLIDFSNVEINRIDISFNQLFDDKKFALEYLEYQKKIRKKNLRITSDSFRSYDTSLMYSSKRYSVKIYHKGAEYNKHDRKEHERINKEKGRQYFNIEELQSFADRILRYEVTFRDSMLSYLFNHKVFRKNCPVHKKKYEIYKKVESALTKNDLIAKTAGTFIINELKDLYIQSHPYIHIDKEGLFIYKKMSKLLYRNRQFFLKTNSNIEEYNTITCNRNFESRALFSKELFIECARFLKAFIKDFQVTEKPSEAVVSDRIDEYNKTHFRKLPKNEMMKFYLMLQNSSFEEIMKKDIYSRATFFRYKSRFKEIGITQNNIKLSQLIHTSIDLGQYHSHILYGKKLINK